MLSPDYEGVAITLLCLYYYHRSIYGYDTFGGAMLRLVTAPKGNAKTDDVVDEMSQLVVKQEGL